MSFKYKLKFKNTLSPGELNPLLMRNWISGTQITYWTQMVTVGWPAVPICPGLREFLGCGSFRAEPETVPCKLGRTGHLVMVSVLAFLAKLRGRLIDCKWQRLTFLGSQVPPTPWWTRCLQEGSGCPDLTRGWAWKLPVGLCPVSEASSWAPCAYQASSLFFSSAAFSTIPGLFVCFNFLAFIWSSNMKW